MSGIRSFLAIDISLSTARALAGFQRTLAGRLGDSRAGVRWVAPQNMHVTIAFLGNLSEPMVVSLSGLLTPAAAAVTPFEMTCSGVGAFPDERNPRVIWAGVSSPAGELDILHRRVTEILRESGFDLDDRPFRSHVTIGRARGDGSAPASCFDGAPPEDFGTTRVRDLCCYRSDLDRKGADYHLLWRLPLTGRTKQTEPSAEGASER